MSRRAASTWLSCSATTLAAKPPKQGGFPPPSRSAHQGARDSCFATRLCCRRCSWSLAPAGPRSDSNGVRAAVTCLAYVRLGRPCGLGSSTPSSSAISEVMVVFRACAKRRATPSSPWPKVHSPECCCSSSPSWPGTRTPGRGGGWWQNLRGMRRKVDPRWHKSVSRESPSPAGGEGRPAAPQATGEE